MAFDRLRLAPDGASGGLNRTFYYNSDDALDDMAVTGYFNDASDVMNTGDFVNLSSLSDNTGGQYVVIEGDDIVLVSTGGGSAPTYTPTVDYGKAQDILDIGDTYETLVDLDIPARVAGLYEVCMSGTFSFDTQSQSILLRFSIDGGTVWNVFSYEPSDRSNVVPFTYMFPHEWAGGTGNFLLQASKEGGGADLDCLYADLWFKSTGVA